MNEQLLKENPKVIERYQQFLKTEILPHVNQLEADIPFRLKLYAKMAQEGMFLHFVPKDLGGIKENILDYLQVMKIIAGADAGLSVAVAVTNMVAEIVAYYGTEKQKQKYLSMLRQSDGVPAAFALTEKEAGSDAKNIQTRAIKDSYNPDYYILNGEKHFISNGDLASFIVVIAKTDTEKTSKNMSAFIVDRGTPGFQVTRKERKLGLLTANLVALKFENCRIHKDNLLGPEGAGMKIAFTALDSGRLSISAQALGIAEAAFDAAVKYAKERRQFGQALTENQAIAFKIADMHVKLSAGNLLMQKAATVKDSGKPYTLEASEAKLYCSESANQIVNDALQIFGGYGYIKDYPMEKYYRDVRVTTIYEGTSEIQRIVIARHLLQ